MVEQWRKTGLVYKKKKQKIVITERLKMMGIERILKCIQNVQEVWIRCKKKKKENCLDENKI